MKRKTLKYFFLNFGYSTALAALCTLTAQPVGAETLDWVGTGTSGTWQTAANWSPAQVPVNNDTVNIGSGDTVKFEAADWKWSGTVNISEGGSLIYDNRDRVTSAGGAQGYYVLLGGAGFNQTGGTVELSASNVSLGYGTNNQFTYNMTGGSFLYNPNTADFFRLGSSSWSAGSGLTVNMNVGGASTFNVKSTIVAQSNTATLTFTDTATATFNNNLWIAYGGTGTVNLGTQDKAFSGSTQFKSTTYVGQDTGTGTLNIYGGNNSFENLYFANKQDSTSSGLIAGGATTVTSLRIGNATVKQTGGELTVTNLTLGQNGDNSASKADKSSQLEIAGGTFTGAASGTISLGLADATTKFLLSDSGKAIFNGKLNMGAAGTTNVEIKGGTLTTNGEFNMGVAGTTNVNISDGTLTTTGAFNMGVAGTTNVKISGGTLTTKGTSILGKGASTTITQSGGSFLATNTIAVGSAGTTSWTITGGTAEFQQWTDFGNGGTQTDITVKDAGKILISGVTAVGRSSGTASMTIGAGGTLQATEGSGRDFHVSVNSGNGSLIVDGGTVDLTASTMLSVGSVNFSASEWALFQVKSGTANISRLIVGAYSADGSRGLAQFSGGNTTINAASFVGRYQNATNSSVKGLGEIQISDSANVYFKDNLTIGADMGTGALNVTGGTLTVGTGASGATTGVTRLGNEAGSTGTLNVSGDSTKVILNQQLIVGASGSGTMNIQGGSVIINSYKYSDNSFGSGLAFNNGSVGSLTISGGSMSYNLGGDFWLGRGGTGSMVVGGTGSFIQNGGNFVVGGNNSTLTMQDGATVTIPYLSLSQSGNNASAEILGGTLNVGNGFRVGVNKDANASALVSGNSIIKSGYLETKTNAGSGNTVLTIEGSHVDWTVTGANSSNAVNIRSGSILNFIADADGVSAIKTTSSGNVIISGSVGISSSMGLAYYDDPIFTLATVNTGSITFSPETISAGWSQLTGDSKKLQVHFDKDSAGANYIDFATGDSNLASGWSDSGWIWLQSDAGQDILLSLAFKNTSDLTAALDELNNDLSKSGLSARQEDDGRVILSGSLVDFEGTLLALNNAYFSEASGLQNVSWQAINGVPEPGSWILLVIGLTGLAIWTNKRRAKSIR